jgi:hypothetical protein
VRAVKTERPNSSVANNPGVRRLGAILFRGLREVLAVLIWLGWWVVWLLVWPFRKALLLLVEAGMWVLLTYVRLRSGQEAADKLRRAWAESDRA